jgi:hypothetical protein
MYRPSRLPLANLPTPLERMKRLRRCCSGIQGAVLPSLRMPARWSPAKRISS